MFSILIPAYKARFLNECIESALAQTYPDFEIIIVDDASPEDLLSIVKKFGDSRLHYYRNETGFGAYNVVGNWNKCLEYAHGEYVICMGDDDVLMQNCLEEYNVLIGKYPTLDIFHGRTILINEEGNYIDIVQSRAEYENIYQFMRHRVDGYFQFIGDFCYRTSTLRKNGGFYWKPFAWGSDDITAYIAIDSKGIANTSRACFKYRFNSQSISLDKNIKIKLVENMATVDYMNQLLDKFACDSVEDAISKRILLKGMPSYLISLQKFLLLQSKVWSRSMVVVISQYRKFAIPLKVLFRVLLQKFMLKWKIE